LKQTGKGIRRKNHGLKKTKGFMLEPLRQLKSKINIRETFEYLIKAHKIRLKTCEPKLRFNREKDKYMIKTAQSPEELEAVLRLRHEVFLEEKIGRHHRTGLDFDNYDLHSDHVMVIDQDSNEVLGTYRIICSRFSDDFYTASEFDILPLLALPGVKLELGRACIRSTHRTGAVMHLLWRAVAHYVKLVEADFLFGCASVFTTKAIEAAAIQIYLKNRNALTSTTLVHPLEKFRDPQVEECLEFLSREEFKFSAAGVQPMIPALFKSYLKMGSQICGLPAFDKDFGCFDYVTLQDMQKITETIERKYGV